ncbi:bacteriocin-like peptide, LSEI_2386 family [Lacticaseibacillus chiayiensis]|uniref:Uncharacterized protein n=1 Tax=Lacticaseibacillus chiayiensis TaxID=2100821 RepID=A0ABY6H685_9LACO|nr:hypothetical protein [Lacticaseibacillus chiayiensis]QVI34209.1 hypothetical protein KG086_10485 [Lacticaseibacillus chiayiensis]UYN55989.1 hypothetical protein OFW50_10965 [Lacticaseibacillus chiayiensis]
MTEKKNDQKKTNISDLSLAQIRGGDHRIVGEAFVSLRGWLTDLLQGKH